MREVHLKAKNKRVPTIAMKINNILNFSERGVINWTSALVL